MKPVVRKLLLSLGATVATLAAAEWITRAIVVAKSEATDFDSYRKRCLGENIQIFKVDESGELVDFVPGKIQGKAIHINAQDFRGKPVIEPKPADAFRICCIGGSTCFGSMSSSDSTTFPAFLELELRSTARVPWHVEVMNGGLPGATDNRATLRYEQHLAKYLPDIVIMYNLINDLMASRRQALGLDPRTRPPVKITGPISELLSHSSIWLVLETQLGLQSKQAEMAQAIRREAARATPGSPERAARMVEVRDLIEAESGYVYDGKAENNLYLLPGHLAQFREELLQF
ncbi:MAG: SGNH/GDSL hydrolase family protein [Planctomycetes bacterium]|nr:SGNH/GDSL hydrolase family protein [Planctomycetota bacterium]